MKKITNDFVRQGSDQYLKNMKIPYQSIELLKKDKNKGKKETKNNQICSRDERL